MQQAIFCVSFHRKGMPSQKKVWLGFAQLDFTMTATKTTTTTIQETCDIWDTDYNSDNWEPEFMTIFVTWQLRVTLDSIRNSCDVLITIYHQILHWFGGEKSISVCSKKCLVCSLSGNLDLELYIWDRCNKSLREKMCESKYRSLVKCTNSKRNWMQFKC